MKLKFSKEFQIGLLVVATIALSFFGINYLKGINIFNPTNYYYLSLPRINGLVETNEVMNRGYKVGFVQKIDFDYKNPSSNVVVILQVDDDMEIPVGSRAALVSGLMGGATVELHLADTGAGIYKKGDTIPAYIDDGILSSITQEVMPRIQTIIPQLDSLIATLHEVAGSNAVENSLKNIEGITVSLKQASGNMDKMMAKDVPVLLSNANNVMTKLDKVGTNLSEVDFKNTMQKLNQTLASVQGVVNGLERGEGTLGMLLHDKSLYNNINTTVGSANELLVDLKLNPKRYVHFSVLGKNKE